MIQPFDGGKFDKRFADVFAPAVERAGLKPYRVDRDPSVSIPVQDIERGIKSADACFVDISADNPNVWFELGYSIALGKDLCIVCTDERSKYPFDIQHRSIIRYQSEAPSDFAKLSGAITARMQAILEQQKDRGDVESIAAREPKDLTDFEITCLGLTASILNGVDDANSFSHINSEMEKAGFNQLATNVALRNLLAKSFVQYTRIEMQDGAFEGYNLTDAGWNWLSNNSHRFQLKKPPKGLSSPTRKSFEKDLDDEIPF
jgi:nucleoside 2-deoxyribosyltransferase